MNPPTLHLEELLSALARKGIPLPFEMGAFLVLETTEQMLSRRAGEPIAHVTAPVVWLNDDGELVLGEAPKARDEAAACKALVELLGSLLVRSAPGVPPMLLELVERGPSDGAWSLTRLRDDLEAALLPLNRSATRRVLARLLRETRREGERHPRAPAPDVRTVDRDVDALFGVAPAAAASDEVEVDVGDEPEVEPEPAPRPAPAKAAAPASRREPRAARPEPRVAPRLTPREELPEPDTLSGGPSPAAALDDFEREIDDGEGRTGLRVGIFFVIAAALLVAAYFVFARGGG